MGGAVGVGGGAGAGASGNARRERGLRCPDCSGALRDVLAGASYGRVILLEQCEGCGGVWFDRWELHFVKEGSLSRLSNVDIKAFLTDAALKMKGERKCPACQSGLKDFRDPTLPADADIKRCPACQGLWLNRRSLGRYARHKAGVKGVALKELDGKELETLKNLQRELDVRTIERREVEPFPFLDDPSVDTREVVTDMAFVILQALLRLVFRF